MSHCWAFRFGPVEAVMKGGLRIGQAKEGEGEEELGWPVTKARAEAAKRSKIFSIEEVENMKSKELESVHRVKAGSTAAFGCVI